MNINDFLFNSQTNKSLSDSSNNSSSANSSPLMQAPLRFELSQVYDEPLNIVWELIKCSDKVVTFLSKGLSSLNIINMNTVQFTSSINQSDPYKKVMIYSSTFFNLSFTFTLFANTLENSTLLTLMVTSKNGKIINEIALSQLISSVLLSISSHFAKSNEEIKQYESTIIRVDMRTLWDMISKWEYDQIPGCIYSNINLKGDPLSVGTEVNLLCNNEFNCKCKIKNIEDKKDSNTWRYIIKPIECRNNTDEIRLTLVKVSDDVTFFSFENVYRFKISKEISQHLTKVKFKLFKEMKKYFESSTVTN